MRRNSDPRLKYLIVVNDFRSLPVFAAYCIALRFQQKNVKVLVSRRFINYFDYGQYLPKWYKSLKLFVLKWFCDVIEVPVMSYNVVDSAMLKGIDSSLQSITYDSGATEEKYPAISRNLRQQALGAKEIASYICSLVDKPELVFLFNGRTASSSPIVNLLHNNAIPINYYEYSIRSGGYHIYPYPCHDSLQLGRDLVKLRKWTLTAIPDLYKKGVSYQANKLNNTFTDYYKSSVPGDFDIAIFLGSDHEYTNLQLEIVKLKVIGNLELIKYVLVKYGANKKIAVRAHPNQMNDPNSIESLKNIVDLCNEYGFTYYGPDSSISSHDLIKKSTLTVVEYSSIAFDAIFLGAKVDVVGDRDLKAILADIQQSDRGNTTEVQQFVRESVVLYDELFFYPFNNLFVSFLCRGVGCLERNLMKFVRF